MSASSSPASTPLVRLADYRAPDWRVDSVELAFDLGIDATEVAARLVLRGNADAPVRLDGEALELLAITLDGRALEAGADYALDAAGLTLKGARDGSVLETRVRILPAANTALEGLYLSGSRESGFLLTQCEAEGFRHITFYPDHPDVLARYSVTLRADKARFPVLLAGGNADGRGELDGGRHWVRFVDPHPKPSYLFALVAGRLEKIEQPYVTAEGRPVKITIWAEADAIGRCHYAMDALVRAMRWDEATYGRNYDLDEFHVVATHDFNMGAMENKGLNIFNAKCLLADPDTTTDDEYRRVEAVIAHEYFHNWSGNRVTCRDWFQLSLKEGFTVFREQSFSAAMNSAPLKRIEDVALLRRAQFPEDAGPLAHPVRPAEYREINNFYTATVYEKGAELVRMLAGRLGPERFRKGTDRYFEANDGRAATIEDFLAALGEANGVDLTPYLAWYGRAGTPQLDAHWTHDAANGSLELTLTQRPPRGVEARLAPLPIPVKLALFGPDGRPQALTLEGRALGTETVLVLDSERATHRFEHVAADSVPSLLRGFSAPVVLTADYTPAQLALLLRHDPDGFNQWEAGQRLAALAWEEVRDNAQTGAADAWCQALLEILADTDFDGALLADLMTPPSEIELAEREAVVDPSRIHAFRESLLNRLAKYLGGSSLAMHYVRLDSAETGALDAASQARRALKRCVLGLQARADKETAFTLAAEQAAKARTMTDRLAALGVLVRHRAPQAAEALAAFRARHADDPLALDKWFAVQAQAPGERALATVQALEADPAFTLKNPNRARALLGTFASANPTGFQRLDGAGCAWFAERLIALDALNPQIAARLATAFNGWQRLEPKRRAASRKVIEQLAGRAGLSRNLAEIMGSIAGRADA